MPRKIEPFSSDVLPHYDGKYRVFDKAEDLSASSEPVYRQYTKANGWATGKPALGWIGVSHGLSREEIDRLQDQLVQWNPNAVVEPENYARKAVKLFRRAAQSRARTGSKLAAQRRLSTFKLRCR